MAQSRNLNPPQIVIIASGAVALVASFLPWVDLNGFATFNAWDDGLFPTYAWPAILGAIMAIQVLVATFSPGSLRDRVAGFTWTQVHLVLAAFSVLIAVSFLIAGEEHGFGFWLSLLAAIGLMVGAVLLEREPASGAAPPPPPGGGQGPPV